MADHKAALEEAKDLQNSPVYMARNLAAAYLELRELVKTGLWVSVERGGAEKANNALKALHAILEEK